MRCNTISHGSVFHILPMCFVNKSSTSCFWSTTLLSTHETFLPMSSFALLQYPSWTVTRNKTQQAKNETNVHCVKSRGPCGVASPVRVYPSPKLKSKISEEEEGREKLTDLCRWRLCLRIRNYITHQFAKLQTSAGDTMPQTKKLYTTHKFTKIHFNTNQTSLLSPDYLWGRFSLPWWFKSSF